ncbi:putative peptidase C19 family protein [Lyophyllum shimeji]|uniref:Ubiquitin carboxyl-terminal hydrolase n=1 Tax=Lyophyllum shimeji TaxID=47721 RepID=A0A9P3PY24_LYOSH|nr:putative peptidase C19 family protein [Lyophyllum shimeji]
MAPFPVQIKHAGKVYDVQLDPDLPPAAFKDAVYQVTGVPVDRMKVMVKGGVLKDDSSWKKIGPKPGQTFMVIGAAGELPKPPPKPIVFLEDMDDAELAATLAKPIGLRNLGNTCYMNASVQALRAIPELQVALAVPALQSATPLPAALRDLYSLMSRTTDSITPMTFLSTLRQVNPQFAEVDRGGKGVGIPAGYAQQDAEECLGVIINTLRNVPGVPSGATPSEPSAVSTKKFVEQFLMGEMRRELTCDEAPEEPPSVSHESVLKIECNIDITTNFMITGIMKSLDQKVEKRSPTLGRDAVYTQKSRMTRLPGYLMVHMVRFAWRQDIGKKTKIMRKVKFPVEFDALDLVTDELKEKLLPASRKLKEIEKDRLERRKVRKRTKTVMDVANASDVTARSIDVDMGEATAQAEPDAATADAVEQSAALVGGKLEDESVYRAREREELEKVINEDVKHDFGASVGGLYDLVAIVTHKGPAADAGHYMGFVKKSVFHGSKTASGALPGPPQASSQGIAAQAGTASIELDEDDEDWYKFDDEKVSVFPREKLNSLDGGGEDSSAYVLIYKTKSL